MFPEVESFSSGIWLQNCTVNGRDNVAADTLSSTFPSPTPCTSRVHAFQAIPDDVLKVSLETLCYAPIVKVFGRGLKFIAW